jgi:hypothetical protein
MAVHYIFLLAYGTLDLRLCYVGITLQPLRRYVRVILELRRSDVGVTPKLF